MVVATYVEVQVILPRVQPHALRERNGFMKVEIHEFHIYERPGCFLKPRDKWFRIMVM